MRKSFDVEGDEVYSFMTHAYVPQNCVPHILNTDEIGQRPYENFVAEIINREVIHWAPIKRQNNGMFPSGNKQQSVRILDQSVDFKKPKDLYGRLMILAKSKETQTRNMQKWTLSLTQRLLFALNGSILSCEDKSKLIHCLDKPHNEINKSKQLDLSKNHIKGSDVPHTSIDKMRKIRPPY